MTSLSPREILQAFDEGLDAASRNTERETDSRQPARHHIIPHSLIELWTRRILENTQVRTLRKTYGAGFASGYRGNTTLKVLLEREGLTTFDELVDTHRGEKEKNFR
jgi:hypothetical protein